MIYKGAYTDISHYRGWLEDSKSYAPCENAPTRCGSEIWTSPGILTLQRDRFGKYLNDQKCRWKFVAPLNHRIVVRFICAFDIESTRTRSSILCYDLLTIKEPNQGQQKFHNRIVKCQTNLTGKNKTKIRLTFSSLIADKLSDRRNV